MGLVADFLPVLAFFAAFRLADLWVATAVLVGVTAVQLAWSRLRGRALSPLQLGATALVLVFGGLTLALHDERFVKWKPTLVNWLFAGAFAGSVLLGREPLVQRLLGTHATLPPAGWRRLNHAWTAFFLFAGAANLAVAWRFETAVWVQFKVFGLLGLTLAFVLLQAVWLSRTAVAAPEGAPGAAPPAGD